jgi:hypothetical protein
MAGNGFLVWHAIDIRHIDGEKLVEIVQSGQFLTLQPKLDDLQRVEPRRLELFSQKFTGFGEETD